MTDTTCKFCGAPIELDPTSAAADNPYRHIEAQDLEWDNPHSCYSTGDGGPYATPKEA